MGSLPPFPVYELLNEPLRERRLDHASALRERLGPPPASSTRRPGRAALLARARRLSFPRRRAPTPASGGPAPARS